MKFSRAVCTLIILLICLIVELITVRLELAGVHNQKKICMKTVSYQASRQVPYLETFKEKKWGIFYRTKIRWNFRTEYYTSWRNESVCCDGYKEIDDQQCEPICKSCTGGICVKPELCLCEHGYRSENGSCVPVCHHDCRHGRCTAPNVCTCDHDYLLNADGDTCDPVCAPPCGEGSYCYKPNECACLRGYTDKVIGDISLLKHLQTCHPVCSRECVNGACIGPNACKCNDGYEIDPNDSVCKPKCNRGCPNGRCVAPNVCVCDEGYLSKSPEAPCEPVCSQPCEKGICVAPESCQCFEGYGLLPKSKYVCEPVCEKACVNGKCIRPGLCLCDEGYRFNGDESMIHICEPYCKFSCGPFGRCTAPNSCTCFEGYRVVNNGAIYDDECKPVCSKVCVNGYCISPNRCECFANHIEAGSNATHIFCKPLCRFCIHGSCDSSGTCRCDEGYEPLNNNMHPFICKLSCDNCTNGYCLQPKKCSCGFGHKLVNDNGTNVCKPICHPTCKNGICVGPYECSCNDGYRPSRSKINVCDSICHEACGTNEVCEAPDQCACKNGYQRYNNESISSGCEPICTVNCGNGTCVAPDHCVCFDGYRNAAKGGCEPICTLCNNGTCIAPEVCECDDGFVLEESDVEDVQSSRHVPQDRSNGSRCVPRCEGCENGDCVAPDECRCRAGFVRAENTCVAACEAGCVHGECIEERRICKCNYGWTGLRCEQPTFCVSIFDNEENRTETLNIVEEQNATFEYVLTYNPACPGCISKVNNETLCFKMHTNGRDEAQIGCLMDGECLSLKSQYNDQKEIIKISGFAIGTGILFLTSAAMVIYVIRRKRRREIDLGNEHSASLQGLMAMNS